MGNDLRRNIEAPPALPPRYGLLVAAKVVDDPGITNGVTFAPEICAGGETLAITNIGNTAALTASTKRAFLDADPFVVSHSEKASAHAGTTYDYEGRARRALAASESKLIAAELWEGTIRTAASLSNVALVDTTSDTLTTAAVSPTVALADVENGIAYYTNGSRGMVHMTPQLLSHLVAANVLVKEGSLWLTPMGNIVVADAGYTGNGPGAAADSSTQWIIGTSMLEVRLGTVDVPGAWGRAWIDPSDNDVTVFAQRPALIVWDECAHVAAQVNIGIPAYAGAA